MMILKMILQFSVSHDNNDDDGDDDDDDDDGQMIGHLEVPT